MEKQQIQVSQFTISILVKTISIDNQKKNSKITNRDEPDIML